MRIPHALTAFGGTLALLAALTPASAQYGGTPYAAADSGDPQWSSESPEGAYGYGPPPGAYYPPGPYADPYGVPGAMHQQPIQPMPPPALSPPGAPSTMNPWPEVSPFYPPNVSYTQHQNKKGLWFRDTVHRQREYEFGVEYILTSFQKPRDTLIGSNYQPFAVFNAGGTTGGGGGTASSTHGPIGQYVNTYGLGPQQAFDAISIGYLGAFPFPFLRTSATAQTAILDGTVFPIHTTGALAGGLDSDGIKLRWGFQNEDGTGWAVSGFWANETNMGFQRGTDNINGIPITQELISANPNIIFTQNGAIPYIYSNDIAGTDHIFGFLGETQKYDIMYRIEWDTRAAGLDVNHYTGLLYKGDSVRVTSYFGGRYMYLKEHFGFRGIDSGFGYDVELPTTGGGGGGGGTNANQGVYRPTGALTFDYPLLDATLNSNVDSHIAGPQCGFRIDLGDRKGFHMWTMTTFGLLANHERQEVNGNNIGVPGFLARPDMHNGVTFNDNRFKDTANHTHVSPLFEQSIFADIRVADILPLLKKSYYLEEAQFRVGYTFTWLGEVQRPGDGINWVGYPYFPTARTDRASFTMNQLSLGLTFPY